MDKYTIVYSHKVYYVEVKKQICGSKKQKNMYSDIRGKVLGL